MSLNRKLLLIVLMILPVTSVFANALKGHVSPYLAMHGDDPVNWREWNADTVQLAQKQGKLLFVSSGYFSCHWCHVMQRESYQNKDIAKILNTYFVAVKVDRELDAALDAHLIDFVERTQGISGWPLNAFVTPDGYPLVGMVYVPPDNFKQILQKLQTEWQKDATSLRRIARQASEELSSATVTQSTVLPDSLAESLTKTFIQQTLTNADTMQGGFGQENKFPSVPQLMTLLALYETTPNESVKEFLTLTLDHMASQGLLDQLGGGFYRYVVDPNWQVPHFEKMLYDNALLAHLYYRAGEVFKQTEYTQVANQTLEFILIDMATNTDAYAASLSAVDNKGIEGGYYLWHRDDLKKILTQDELAVVSLYWQLDGAPDLEDGHHLVQAASRSTVATQLKMNNQQVEQLLASASAKMLAVRAKRVLPKDSKILSAWNGLVLTALVEGTKATGSARYQQKAAQLAEYIGSQLWDKQAKLLKKASAEKGAFGVAALEDYAYVAQGLYSLWQVNKNKQTEALLKEVLEQAWTRFYGKQGWQLAEDMLLKYGTGKTVISDGPMPAPSAVLIRTSYEYGVGSNNKQLVNRALRAMNVGYEEMNTDAFWFATQIDAIRAVNTRR